MLFAELDRPAVPTVSVEWWDSARREQALAAWFALEQQLGGLPVVCSADWTAGWLRHYGSIVPHRFAVGWADDRIVGLLLLTRGVEDRDGCFPVRTWHFGTAGESDADSVCVEYNALACEPAYRNAFFKDVIAALQTAEDWDELRCDGFAVGDLPQRPDSEPVWTERQRFARWIDLDRVRASGRELISFFGDSTRKHIRQNLRDCGQLQVQMADRVEDAHRIFDELIALHQQRWSSQGQPGCYRSRVFTAFHRELIDRLTPDGRVVLARVTAHGQTIGCTQFFIDRGRALNYQGGRLANSKKHSPGLVTDYACMQACLERGYAAYDFMAGDSLHKQRMTTDTTPLTWGVFRRPRLKFAVMNQLRRAKQLATGWATPSAEEVTP
jgi:hypothetical protein